jgi:hypothetical protein
LDRPMPTIPEALRREPCGLSEYTLTVIPSKPSSATLWLREPSALRTAWSRANAGYQRRNKDKIFTICLFLFWFFLPSPMTFDAVAPLVSTRAGNRPRGKSKRSRTNSSARDSITVAMLCSCMRTWHLAVPLKS